MKIAILHDLLVKLGGAEKVLEKIIKMYPNADLFTLIYDEKKVAKVFPKEKIKDIPKITQNIYDLTKNQRLCLLFMSRAIESIDLSGYDIVIALNSAFVHGAITKPETKFIVYYHSPTRYLWDWTNEYKKEIGWNKGLKGLILNSVFKNIRIWDYIASKRHNITLANSLNVKKRIKKYYGLDAEVIYPNVETKRFDKEILGEYKKPFKNYHIIISTLAKYKNIEMTVNNFNKMPEKNLVIVGSGAQKEYLQSIANKNIYFSGFIPDEELIFLLKNSDGLIFSGEEDFGITPIEAFGAGKPVFAYRGGGLEETMVEGITGDFFDSLDGKDFIKKFLAYDEKIKKNKFDENSIKEIASKYDEDIFEKKIREVVGF